MSFSLFWKYANPFLVIFFTILQFFIRILDLFTKNSLFYERSFAKSFNVLYVWILLFCSDQVEGSLSWMTRCFFQVADAEQWNVFVFLDFFILILNFQRSRFSLFVAVFLQLCPYASLSRFYHPIFVPASTFIFIIRISSVVKNWLISAFPRFWLILWFAIDFIQSKAELIVC